MAKDPGSIQLHRDAAKGLATLALLKANFDSGRDHIDMFTPFVFDCIGAHPTSDFAAEDVRALLESRHRLPIPMPPLRTILARAVKRGALRREGGRYFRDVSFPKSPDITASREATEARQRRLAAALREFSQTVGMPVPTDDNALELLLGFLARHHVNLVLDSGIGSGDGVLIGSIESQLTSREERLVALFITRHAVRDHTLLDTLRQMLDGFVLQNALLLSDINTAKRRFSDLIVFFDTGFALEALGLKGKAAGLAAREALDLLRDRGAELAIFDRTVDEIKLILRVYEEKLGTFHGIASLYPTEVTRYVLTHHLAPSDLQEQISLLESNLRGLGLTVRKAPARVPQYTLGEAKLTEMIKRPQESEVHPRVIHDVNCIAAVLTLRRGRPSQSYDDARAVFATTTGLLVTNVRKWYHDEGGIGVPPVIHQLALSNIAWLKNPTFASSLKLNELVALCSAALVPPRRVWELFTKHLRDLRDSDRISSDEMVAIVASDLTDSLLWRFDDDIDIDAETIAEVVERVREHHQADARQAIKAVEQRTAEELAIATAAQRSAEEEAKRREEALRKVILRGRSLSAKWASRISWGLFLLAALVIVVGSSVSVPQILGTNSTGARLTSYLVSAFLWVSGIAGLLWGGYLSQWRGYLEGRLEKYFRALLLGDGSEEGHG